MEADAGHHCHKAIQRDKADNEEEAYLLESDAGDGEEADDDSPYRVKITLDQLFLSYLEDSNITRGVELKDRYKDVITNVHFQQIIRREIEIMFGTAEEPPQLEVE